MGKAIFFKEWLKTKYFFALSLFVTLCFVSYALLKINRIIEFRGTAHLWEVLLQKDVVLIDILQYLPLITGILFGMVQFIPEMAQKRLKLTLHLPYPHNRMILLMLCAGLVMLLSVFIINNAVIGIYLNTLLAHELSARILLTALPWYVAGISAYLLTAWICLEPTWRRRIVNMLLAAGVLRIFFLGDVPQALDYLLWPLIIYTASTIIFPLLSVTRFKEGRQD